MTASSTPGPVALMDRRLRPSNRWHHSHLVDGPNNFVDRNGTDHGPSRTSTGTVTPWFPVAQTSVGGGGRRRTSCYFRCYFRPGRGLVRPGRGPEYEKTAISRGFL